MPWRPLAKGKAFAVHFEKACDRFKGIYQGRQSGIRARRAEALSVYQRERILVILAEEAKRRDRPVGFVKNIESCIRLCGFYPAPLNRPRVRTGTIKECSDD